MGCQQKGLPPAKQVRKSFQRDETFWTLMLLKSRRRLLVCVLNLAERSGKQRQKNLAKDLAKTTNLVGFISTGYSFLYQSCRLAEVKIRCRAEARHPTLSAHWKNLIRLTILFHLKMLRLQSRKTTKEEFGNGIKSQRGTIVNVRSGSQTTFT